MSTPGTQQGRSLGYFEMFGATSKNWKFSGKSLKNATSTQLQRACYTLLETPTALPEFLPLIRLFHYIEVIHPKQDPRKIAYILIESTFFIEIFSERWKICVCMKKAQSCSVDYYTECFDVTRFLIVAKVRRLHISHWIKSYPYPQCVERKWLPRGTQEGRSLWYLEKFSATSKNCKFSGKSLKNAT